MNAHTQTTAWTLLCAAVLAWCFVGAMFWRTSALEKNYVENASQEQSSSGQAQGAAVAHASVVSSAQETARLQSALSVDPVSFANDVQSVGAASGATLQISSALPESTPSQSAPKGSLPIYAFGFTIQADGSFASLMRALQLLQTLPAPSSIEEVDIERSPSPTGQGPWQMNARIRLVTTDNIAS